MLKPLLVPSALFYLCFSLPAAELHVSPKGNDAHPGTAAKPYRTISAAAQAAQPGDVITIHAGTYRERITPPRGGTSDARRITYQAAPGEVAEIKGSEVVREWKPYQGNVWKVSLPKAFFGTYNPFLDVIEGDWFTDKGRRHHTGAVYLNGAMLLEAATLDAVLQPKPYPDAREPAAALLAWFTESDAAHTHLYANFQGKNPNTELVEVSVRDSCFYPDQPGRDYITIRGLRLRHAATQWAAPTAEQIGLIGTHWSKGWVIENNVLSDSRCSCLTLGKDRATGHNVWTRNPKKDGATHYNEVILRAREAGWSRENIGSHTVRNNVIYNCEQAGIAGSLGAIFSTITGNHIYNVWRHRQFTGAEMGGIKLHGAIDVLIKNNRIHNTGRGLWMDWMAQGTRISTNLLYDNTTDDLFVEVNHGPFLVDNNIFLSSLSLQDWSEGGAYAHNFFGGRIVSRPELNRWTPYHRAHSTALAGVTLTHGGDSRFYNNIFVGGQPPAATDNARTSSISGYGLWVYDTRKFPTYTGGNVYLRGARPHARETGAVELPAATADPRIIEEHGKVYLQFRLDPAIPAGKTVLVTTGLLGKTEVAELPYHDTEGNEIEIRPDYFGKPVADSSRSAGPFGHLRGDLRVHVW
ncbi:MAG: right-handed parallel beta-helix repeat-containing protein [Bryobacterales bacterium]|nr:right-handed parallel beta-helix repeat-containing protein [Bryobacterales bacterium]